MKNAFSIDVEDWFCVQNMSHIYSYQSWDGLESRVKDNTLELLSILNEFDTKATFFVLGWVAQRNKDLIKKIADNGHEIASHGYSHRKITEMSEQEFKDDIEKSLEVLSQITSAEISGYRAPSFTITEKTMWAIDILKDFGFKYDSSIFPIGGHPDYGIAGFSEDIIELREDFYEFPMTVVKKYGMKFPVSGGGYFRLFPYTFTKQLLKNCNNFLNRQFVFYLHPWEIDFNQPKVPLDFVKKFRHYNNLKKTKPRLKKLLSDFEFTTIKEVLGL